jgi:hypothetical protein
MDEPMIHPPEALLNKVVRFAEDVPMNGNILFRKDLVGLVTADLDDVLAIQFAENIPNVEHRWITFKDMSWLRDKLEIVNGGLDEG